MINQIDNIDLGTCDKGCRCQAKVEITVIDNKIEELEVKSDIPKGAFDECGVFDDSISIYPKITDELEDGAYEAVIELACWTDYHYEYGLEGDGESAIQIIKRIGDID
jgi:hypothetical protein